MLVHDIFLKSNAFSYYEPYILEPTFAIQFIDYPKVEIIAHYMLEVEDFEIDEKLLLKKEKEYRKAKLA